MSKKCKDKKQCKFTSIGGQALMEGIMMRGPEKTVMCVRRMDGSITTEEHKNPELTVWNKIPVLRGVVNFAQSMASGTKMLMRSAEYVIEDEEAAEAAQAEKTEACVSDAENAQAEIPAVAEEITAAGKEAADTAVQTACENAENADTAQPTAEAVQENIQPAAAPTVKAVEIPSEKLTEVSAAVKKPQKNTAKKADGKNGKKEKDKDKRSGDAFMNLLETVAMVLGFGLAIVLFFFLPTWAYDGLMYILPDSARAFFEGANGEPTVWRSLFEGAIKIIIFVGYMLLCTTMKEIRTLFQYHGAEHKTIFCYEAGEELTVENVRKYKRFHPRCGTSFIMYMLILGILLGIAISWLLPEYGNSMIIRPLIKLACIPLLMGVGYELLKLAGKHDNVFTRIMSAPGLWLQRISTREPTDEQIECAIAAILPVIPENGEDMQ